jgi:hypothetical protein
MLSVVTLPIKKDPINGRSWAELSAQAPSATHIICGEKFHHGSDVSFYGGHRVREFKFKKNVWWSIVTGFDLNIDAVPIQQPASPPRRQVARHDKRI